MWDIDHYPASPLMSCYLVAVVIGQLECETVESPVRDEGLPTDRPYAVEVK